MNSAILVLGLLIYGATQLYAGWVGIAHQLGTGWATAAVVLMLCRFSLPMTIGSFFCAMNVWHWHWAAALAFSAPGLAIMLLAVPGAFASLLLRVRPKPRVTPPIRSELIDIGTIQASEYNATSLSTDQVHRIQRLEATFRDAEGGSLGRWIDNFSRDANPENELRLWEHMANVYSTFVSSRPMLTALQRKEAFGLLVLRSMSPSGEVRRRRETSHLSEEDCHALMSSF